MKNRDNRVYWLWLSHACSQGSKCAVELVRSFGDAKAVYEADEEALNDCNVRITKPTRQRLLDKDLNECYDIISWCDRCGVSILCPDGIGYPQNLLSLQDAPMVLYAAGKLPDFDNLFSLAVVGTRKMTEYGKKIAYDIGTGVADAGGVLVSGLALGVDGMAMAGAVSAGGVCVAVLGCGIDIVYPKEHEQLLRKVMEKGAVITEYAPGVSPLGSHFPVRNRLISGISQAVCVVEGNMASGSLITARHAIYQGKPVYAVPGRVDEASSQGPIHLLKQGAIVACGALDILEDYEFVYPHSLNIDKLVPHISADMVEGEMGIGRRGRKKPIEKQPVKEKKEEKKEIFEPAPVVEKPKIDVSTLSEDDMKVLEAMEADVPMLADELCGRCFMSVSQVMVSLTMLEISGAIEAGAGGYFMKRAADFCMEPEYITEDDDGL